MPPEDNAGLAPSEPADTLDSILDKAITASEAPPPAEGEAAASEPKPDKTGRLHGEGGKFAPKNSAAEASKPEPAQAAKTEALTPAVEPAKAQPVEPPARWTTEEKAEFAKWSPEVQKAVAERQKAMDADYTRKTQEAADIRRNAEPLLNAIKPFENYLSQLGPVTGQQAPQLIAGLLGVEYRLRTGNAQEKYSALANIAQQYGIDLAALARGEIREPDPATTQLRQQLSDLVQWKSNFEQQVQQQQTEQAYQYLENLKIATDEAGKPRYPLFEQVRIPVSHMLATGEAKSYDEAYQKAAAPINALVAQELNARQQQVDTQRKDALAKADKAAPVRSSGSQPGGSAQGKGLDAHLEAAFTKHGM